MSKTLKISIVTVVYNDMEAMQKTMQSVKEQTYENIEYLVIDGGSDDGTLELINSSSEYISFVLSESDKGIYDAMNKGAAHATGDYITFLNAGDVYYSDDAIEKVFAESDVCDNDAIYGSNYYHKKNGKMQLQVPRPLELFYRGMPFNHQSVFVKSGLVKKYPFKDKVYRIQCEYEFLLNLYLKGYQYHRVKVIVAIYEAEGFSDLNFLERTLERWIIVKRAGICDEVADAHYFDLVNNSLNKTKEDAEKTSLSTFKDRILSLFSREPVKNG